MITFRRNMGTLDRAIRAVVGIVLLAAGPATELVHLTPIQEIVLGILGTFAILSAVLSYCLLYEFTNSNTIKNKS